MVLSSTVSPLQSPTKKEEMWRSKLGTNYPKDFMEKNEARLFREIQTVREWPENRTCADCGVRGTNWASVNLGVFLCMTCGSHHRSLGTHISLPKGCSGTYLWGPDEIERMASIGNARAKELYGDSPPPNGVTNDDPIRWKEYLTDKYVHKKFAPVTSTGSTGPSKPFISGSSSIRPASPKTPKTPKLTKKLMVLDPDLIRFDDDLDRSPGSPYQSTVACNKPQTTSPQPSSVQGKGKDFFAEFGL